MGMKVQSLLIKHEKGYYVIDKQFSVPELKMLINAVQAAGFITPKKTAEFIDKIADLGGSHRTEILKTNMVCFNATKHIQMNRSTITYPSLRMLCRIGRGFLSTTSTVINRDRRFIEKIRNAISLIR